MTLRLLRGTGGLVLVVWAGVVACGGPGPAATPVPAPGAHDHGHDHAPTGNDARHRTPLAQLFSAYSSDFDPAPTRAALAERSTTVVTARLEEIREGRVKRIPGAEDVNIEHLVHVFAVTGVLRGDDPGPRVFVETPKPGRQPAAVYDAARPAGGEAVLYLVPRPDRPDPAVPDPRAGLDPGANPMRPTTPQGFLLLDADAVTAPMAVRIPTERLFPAERIDEHDPRSWQPGAPT